MELVFSAYCSIDQSFENGGRRERYIKQTTRTVTPILAPSMFSVTSVYGQGMDQETAAIIIVNPTIHHHTC